MNAPHEFVMSSKLSKNLDRKANVKKVTLVTSIYIAYFCLVTMASSQFRWWTSIEQDDNVIYDGLEESLVQVLLKLQSEGESVLQMSRMYCYLLEKCFNSKHNTFMNFSMDSKILFVSFHAICE
jgi:hypothetical protein